MKKFLLSIFAVLFAFAGAQAQETAELSFADKAQRTSFSTEQQVWEQNGITLTNTKSSSTSNVADYANPARFYKNSEIIVECSLGNITKIEFTCSTGNYANALKNSISGSTASGSVVTVTLDGTSKSYTISSLSGGQVRMNSLIVTYTTAGGEGGETPVLTAEKPVFNPESQEFNLGESVTVEISAAEGAKIYYTTDGETPTKDSDVYENALTITETTTVKAIAVIEGHNNSDVAEATYTAVDPNAKTAEIVAKDLGYENAADVNEIKIGDYITVTFEIGTAGYATKYYNTGSGIRNYNGNVIIFTAPVGVTINSIVFTAAGTSYTENPTNLSSGTATIDGTVTTISNIAASTLSFTQSSNTSRIQKIEVSYSVEEGVVVIATPSIAGEATFVGSTTVEITNNAAGTTLYYSTDDENYAVYSEALNITETTTVYAYAQDAQGNKSSVASATFTKLELLSIAEAKAAYDEAGANVDVAMDLTGAVVTVNSGQYMFIENETTGINIYNSDAKYAVGTKFTSGYILGASAVYGKMHQITNAEFNNVETTTIEVVPTEVAVADLNANFNTYEGRFVRLTGADINGKNIAQGENAFGLYDRFDFITAPTSATGCDIEGIVARYNTTLQIFPVSISNTINVTEAGFATLYLAYPVVIPADVKAYTVTEVAAGYVTLTQVTGVLPANTGVIVEAGKGSYDFVYSADEATAVTDNKLLGSAVNTYVNGDAYVLGNVNGIGLYKAVLNKDADGAEGTTHFLNNANKAYLPANVASGAASYSFRFGEGTTGINEVKGENGNVKAIFDLTGRRVENISAPGIYIINGVKTLVK